MHTWRDRTIAVLFLTTTTAATAALSGACTFSSQGQGGDAGAPEPGYAAPDGGGGDGGTGTMPPTGLDAGSTGPDGAVGCTPSGDNPGCGPPVTVCGPGNCSGCCDQGGACQSGQSNAFCGMAGSSCQTCAPPSSCNSGACLVTPCGPGNCAGCCATDGTCVGGGDDAACGSGGGVCTTCPSGSTCRFPQGCVAIGNAPCTLADGGPLDLSGTWTGTSTGPGGSVSATLTLAAMGPGARQYKADLSLDPSIRGAQCPASGPIDSTFVASLSPSGSGCMLNGNAPVGSYTSGVMLQVSASGLTGNASPACSAPPFNGTLLPP